MDIGITDSNNKIQEINGNGNGQYCTNPLSLSLSNTSTIESKTNLIVNYLPQTMTNEELKSIFQTIGPLESCKLIKDKTSHQSLCYGFVNFANIEDAERAIKTLNGLKLENKIIKVSYARPSSESIKGANLYICGIPKNWTLEDMNNYFSSCGKIITSRILFNSLNGQSKGVGFIRFDQRYEADAAINKLHGSIPDGSQEPITVKFANYPTDTKTSKVMSPLPTILTTTTPTATISPGYMNSTKMSKNSQYQPTSSTLAALRSTGTTFQILPTSTHSRYPVYGTDFICNDNLLPATALISAANHHPFQTNTNNCIPQMAPTTGWCLQRIPPNFF